MCELSAFLSRNEEVAGFCEQGNERSGPIQSGQFLDKSIKNDTVV